MASRNIKRMELEPARYGMTGRGVTASNALTSEGLTHAMHWSGPIDAPEMIPRGSVRQSFTQAARRGRYGRPAYVYAAVTDRR